MPATTEIEGIEFERIIQSAFRIKADRTVVYVDPHRAELLRGHEKADLILITHAHRDHLDPAAIRAILKDDTVLVTNLQTEREARSAAPHVVKLQEGQHVTEKGVEIRAVPGYNHVHPRGFNTGFVFRLGGKNIYHAGDTSLVPEMSELSDIDVALLPIGGTFTMDEVEAGDAVGVIQPRWAIPMHYGYATGGDPERFRRRVGDAAKVVIL